MDRATRSRGIIIAAALVLAALLLPGVALAAIGSPAAKPSHPTVAAIPRCRAANIEVWLGLNPDGAAAGTTYYPLEFTNDGVNTHTCYLAGKPGVIAINGSGHRIGPAISGTNTGTQIVLKPGQTAYSRIGIVQSGFIHGCQSANASGLEVSPPGVATKQPIFDFTFSACKNKTFMHDVNVVAGVGIP